jgi:hypothetical protein
MRIWYYSSMAGDEKSPDTQPAISTGLKVSLPDTMPADVTVEKVVDSDIEEFNRWFQTQGNDPVIPFEKAIIKTYIGWKLGLAKKG